MSQLIAIIEDDPAMAEFLATILEDAGYETVVSSNHDTILQLVQEVRPDLFIIDLIRGPEYVGAVTLSVLRDHPPTATVPAILCSGRTAFLHAQRQALARRKCLPLAKPFLYQELLDVVEEALALV